MNFRNENARIYSLIHVFTIGLIISAITIALTDYSTILNYKLLDILMLFWSLNCVLIGTKKIIAQHNKKGYIDYFAVIAFICIYNFI